MKKLLLGVLALFVLNASAFAADAKEQRNIGIYLGSGFYTSGLAFGVSYKAPITKAFEFSKAWGGKWGYEVVAITSSGTSTFITSDITYRLSEVAGLATYTWDFAKNQSATVKTGLGIGKASTSYANYTYLDTSITIFGISYGASYNYDLGKAGIVSVGYYDFSFGVTYAYKF